MTGQPTVYIGIFFSMAFNTFPHAPDFSGQTLQILHLAVAFLAGDFAIDVALVVKQHVLGHVILCRNSGVLFLSRGGWR
jgi:hypothetical protein